MKGRDSKLVHTWTRKLKKFNNAQAPALALRSLPSRRIRRPGSMRTSGCTRRAGRSPSPIRLRARLGRNLCREWLASPGTGLGRRCADRSAVLVHDEPPRVHLQAGVRRGLCQVVRRHRAFGASVQARAGRGSRRRDRLPVRRRRVQAVVDDRAARARRAHRLQSLDPARTAISASEFAGEMRGRWRSRQPPRSPHWSQARSS
jgi:hypothetical protein